MTLKLEKFIFYFFLFSIPFQTRLILWQWTRPFNEWTASFLYLTDILLVILFLFWLWRSLKKHTVLKLTAGDRLLIAFFVISAFSIFNSKILGLSFYRLLKLAEFVLFYFYLKANLGNFFDFKTAANAVLFSGFFQAIVAIGQHIKQGSLGLKILGESIIGINIPNVAVFTANGQKYLRAYGTTPHANVLSAWLLLALFAFYFLYSNYQEKRKKIWLLGYAVLLFGFFFTFSRTAIGIWGISVLIGLWFFRKYKSGILPIVLATLILCLIFALFFWPQVKARIHISADEDAVTQRIYYNQIASKFASNHPLGVGIGQFVVVLMDNFKHYPFDFYQPVHNIYLLIADEVGFVGIAIFLAFLVMIFWDLFKFKYFVRAYFLAYSLVLLAVLFMGLFDHFLWTIQQGSMILWLSLASAYGLMNSLTTGQL